MLEGADSAGSFQGGRWRRREEPPCPLGALRAGRCALCGYEILRFLSGRKAAGEGSEKLLASHSQELTSALEEMFLWPK